MVSKKKIKPERRKKTRRSSPASEYRGSSRETDEHLLHLALELANESIGLTSPNPCVGAVIVDSKGRIVSQGSHTFEGVKHAEVVALEQAGARARGATLYINLEPCSHQGRTGACADAIIAAGIRRVVACMQDPNPLVAGKGFERLRNAGVSVASGILKEEAKALNEAFAIYIRHRTPLITLKAAMTLDGKIAPPPRDSHNPTALGGGGATGGWITSEVARAHVHKLRHQHDAIMVGVGTIIADDPLLTDRSGRPRRRPLLRVIVDSRLRLPPKSRVVKTAKDDVLVLCSLAEENRKQQLQNQGIRVEQVPVGAADGRPDMAEIARRLGTMEITSLLIEGGAMINGAALVSGIVDKVFLFYAPRILAGTGSVPFATGAGFAHVSDAAYVKSINLHRFGEDFAVEGYLRDPYGE
jgi:diaminohydroxyphosphoribosylaminopyrimidine deaminase / 5-amino-6-(5-phosphoribosylamino)uracil reductase